MNNYQDSIKFLWQLEDLSKIRRSQVIHKYIRRYSTDDLCTAYVAFKTMKELSRKPKTSLDLGCGLGSVLLFTAFQYPDCHCTGIEAQEISVELLRRSLIYNGVENRTTLYNHDFRTVDLENRKFELVTGTPPYFPINTVALSAKVDQKACLCEFRGGVEDYCSTAKRYLAPGGRFVVVGTAYSPKRFENGAEIAGLLILERWDFIPKIGKPPLFSVCVMCHKDEVNSIQFIIVSRKDK